jgi:spore germination cell wall hydrolase CwlJ-like protein
VNAAFAGLSPMTRHIILAIAALLCAGAAFGMLALNAKRSQNDAVMVPVAKASALVEATAGERPGDVRAIGEDAKLINAAMPFNSGPILAANRFVIPAADANDHGRALLCLTQAVYYEAGFEPLEGRRAVAQVVLNRTKHPAYPKSVCGVVYQRNATPVCQFTFVCDGSLDRRPEPGTWNEARRIAAAALAGYVEKSVGSATHYHADYVAPRWAPMLAKISKIGAHIFYRWQGAWGLPGAFTGRYIGEPRDPATMRPLILAKASDGDVAIEAAIAQGPVTDGTLLKRAPNDVGGLLDTSKGWTLNIPLPQDSESDTKSVVVAGANATLKTAQNDAPAQSRVIVGR